MASEDSKGIPTARSIDHVGVSVPDLDEAVEYFEDVLGAELVYRATPPIDESVSDWMERNLGVHPDTTMRLAKLRLGPNVMVELLDYDDPTGRDEAPKNSDNGASHICFYVDDMEAALEYFEDVPDTEVLGDARLAEEGPEEGQTFVYVTTPWGFQLELITTPDDTAFKQSDREDWHKENWYVPAPSWDARPQWDEDVDWK
jgi:catechol 2,3-dioxygenase-like lactoylglutathione lyase family enzyme